MSDTYSADAQTIIFIVLLKTGSKHVWNPMLALTDFKSCEESKIARLMLMNSIRKNDIYVFRILDVPCKLCV